MLDPRLHPLVAAELDRLATPHEVMDCDPDLADTAAFCAAYGIEPADSANTILIASKRPAGVIVATIVLATHRLDVNKAVRDAMGVSKVSFADSDTTVTATGMMLGGVTPFGLPREMRVLVDGWVMSRDQIVLGGGNRTSKLRIAPDRLLDRPGVEVVESLANPIA